MNRKQLVVSAFVLFTALLYCSRVHAQIQGTAVLSGGETKLPLCQAHTCTEVWGAGTVSLTANGQTVSVGYGQGSTVASVSSSLCARMTSSFPVQCTGTTVNGNSATMNIHASSNIPVSTACRINTPPNVSGCLFSASINGFFNPAYYILSVLYSPPGDHSSNGFANTNSTGTTTSIGSNFAQGSSTTYSASGGLLGQGGLGVTFGVSAATGTTDAFQVTYSQGTGSQLQSDKQNIDHTQDQFFLWLNPQVTLTSSFASQFPGLTTSTMAATYSIGTPNNDPMDIVNVNVAGLQNPSEIPLAVLLPQTVQPGVTLPGLANICAHPLPPSQCTQSNACGCVPSDFANILAADPLITVAQTTPPSSIDSKRFVLVNSQVLEGPQQSGAGPVLNSFTESDSSLTSVTETESQTNTSSYSTTSGVDIPFLFTLKITDTTTFSFTNTESQGVQNGSAHQASVILGSDKVQCFEHVDIYEDTAYHTFAFALPATPPAACQ